MAGGFDGLNLSKYHGENRTTPKSRYAKLRENTGRSSKTERETDFIYKELSLAEKQTAMRRTAIQSKVIRK